jgi:hypothetical protein
MKTRLTQFILATFLVAFLVAGNVNAKGTELMIVSSLENVVEPELEVEDWMLNENNWVQFDKSTYVATQFSEENLAIESWMLNENNWVTDDFQFQGSEAEQMLMLEDWMTNEVYWN